MELVYLVKSRTFEDGYVSNGNTDLECIYLTKGDAIKRANWLNAKAELAKENKIYYVVEHMISIWTPTDEEYKELRKELWEKQH